MLNLILFGLVLGWGVAIPIGAINLEMVRRNLQFGTLAGMSLGLGACSADVTYLTLLSLGVLHFLDNPLTLKIIGILGSCILAWFGYSALHLKAVTIRDAIAKPSRPLWRHVSEGYVLTLVNPYTIIFWSSISATIAVTTNIMPYATLYAGAGVMIGTFSWVCGLNLFLHWTRHRFSKNIILQLNILGGLIIIGFALYSFWHAIKS